MPTTTTPANVVRLTTSDVTITAPHGLSFDEINLLGEPNARNITGTVALALSISDPFFAENGGSLAIAVGNPSGSRASPFALVIPLLAVRNGSVAMARIRFANGRFLIGRVGTMRDVAVAVTIGVVSVTIIVARE